LGMSELKRLEEQVAMLSPDDLARFRAWFAEFDAALWDAQIERDAKGGKLDGLVAEALEEYRTDKAREF